MIKRLFLLSLVALMLLPSLAWSSYEQSKRVTAVEVVDRQNNFVLIEDHNEQWLIHHKTGCGDVVEGDELTLVIRGELDGNRETLWKGNTRSCEVDQAELITGKLRVTSITSARTHNSVSDNGAPYRIYHSERCDALRNLKGKDVYVRKYGLDGKLRAGDKFFLPGAGEMCAITFVQSEIYDFPEPEPVVGDIKRPTTPTNFRAIPGKTGVYLYWDRAKDDGGIAYYVISASLWHVDDPVARDPSMKPQEMDGTFKTGTNRSSYKLEGLQSDELYFFRVIAVDTSGNESSYWSKEATAFTKSAIAEVTAENSPLRIFKMQETSGSYLYRWSEQPGAKYSVALEVDGERVFGSPHWGKNYIRILKKAERKGKEMELIVRSLNFRGLSLKATTTFGF